MTIKAKLSYYSFRKLFWFSFLLFSLSCGKVLGQSAGFKNTFIVLSLNGGANAYYDLNSISPLPNPDFNNANLGSFPTTGGNNTLVLKGADHYVWKCNGCDITATTLCYRVYLTGSTPPNFTCTNINQNVTGSGNGCSGEDQRWEKTDLNINLTQGLAAGSYTLEVYSEAATSCGTQFASNLGANYKATFTVFNPIGPWASAVYLYNNRVNSLNSDFYNSMKPGGENNISNNRDFTGYLGEYRLGSNTLQLTGGEIKTFKNMGYDICKAELCYTVYLSGQRPSTPTFTCINLNFYQDCCIDQSLQIGCNGAEAKFPNSPGICQTGDEKWQSPGTNPTSGFPIDLTNRPTGLYVMEVYYQVYGRALSGSCSSPTIVYDNNNDPANNYKVSFLILAPLPSKDIDLLLSRANRAIQLNWNAQEAASFKNYHIEHSLDGQSFKNIGQIQNTTGAGTASYRFLHNQPASGINFYRIKAETERGVFVYSSIRQLNLGSVQDQLSVTVMQSGDIIRFLMPTDKVYKLTLINASGQLVKELQGIRNQVKVDLSAYPKGYYIARFTSDSEVINSSFVKK
jgi:hypothetical protein